MKPFRKCGRCGEVTISQDGQPVTQCQPCGYALPRCFHYTGVYAPVHGGILCASCGVVVEGDKINVVPLPPRSRLGGQGRK